jgi:SAM-dependent methyltransferase
VVTLVCPVRGCGAPLGPAGGSLICPRGHRFDLARSGYCNLLQPQDRRSRRPGDSAAALAARRRLFDHGHGDWLAPHLLAAFDAMGLPPGAAVLDVGCGEGFHLGALAAARSIEAHGLDISAPAVDLAARRYPQATWVVANADRFLPYPAGSFGLAMALTSRLNSHELRRVLAAPARISHADSSRAVAKRPGSKAREGRTTEAYSKYVEGGRLSATPETGHFPAAQQRGCEKCGPAAGDVDGCLLVGVPGADDLVELRAAVLGEGRLRDRLQAAIAILAPDFELVRHVTARARLHLDAAELRDLLAATYRAGRERQRRRAAELTPIEVTVSRDLACFRPRPLLRTPQRP